MENKPASFLVVSLGKSLNGIENVNNLILDLFLQCQYFQTFLIYFVAIL